MIRENYFDSWNVNSAYFLGLIWADGNVYENSLRLGFKSDDVALLETFATEIGYANKFYVQENMTSITVKNKKIVNDLRLHGIIPRKSFIDNEYPNVPDDYFVHFLRGYFDGDGSIFKTSQGYHRVAIVGGHKFLLGLKKQISVLAKTLSYAKLRKHCKSNVYNLEWSKKEEIVDFVELLYLDATICLERKKQDALKFKEEILPGLNLKGIGLRGGDTWRVRVDGVEYGRYRNLQDAKFVRDIMAGKNIPITTDRQRSIITLRLKKYGIEYENQSVVRSRCR